jgi:hypothetical protein
MNNGNFVISLDFELMWGVFDQKSLNTYGENVIGVHEVLPKILDTFERFNIRATVALVGFLFYENKKHLLFDQPDNLPEYFDVNLNPYDYISKHNLDENLGKYYFAPQLIEIIKKYSNIEIASHTFSHYLCLEPGQTIIQFESDFKKFISIAKKNNIQISSIVFPRNQYSDEYLNFCYNNNILAYRGNENSWYYKPMASKSQHIFTKIFRLIDTYLNLSGHNCYDLTFINKKKGHPLNIPSSRFLRPFNNKLIMFERLRLNRIKNSMTYAAKNNLTYHLWWHPHNFGKDIDSNIFFLEKILQHYIFLNKNYDFKSESMSRIAKQYLNEH